MDHERLNRVIDRSDRQTQTEVRKAAKRKARLEKRNRRKQERMAPYRELRKRNEGIYDRVSSFTDVSEQNQVNIIIGPAKQTPTAPNHMFVARLATNQWSFNGTPRKRASICFFAVPKEAVSFLQENPSEPYRLEKLEAEEVGREYGFDIDQTGAGGFSASINRRVSDRAFSPIRAIRRAIDVTYFSQRLDQMELSMDMVEEAACNPELNPGLVTLNSERHDQVA